MNLAFNQQRVVFTGDSSCRGTEHHQIKFGCKNIGTYPNLCFILNIVTMHFKASLNTQETTKHLVCDDQYRVTFYPITASLLDLHSSSPHNLRWHPGFQNRLFSLLHYTGTGFSWGTPLRLKYVIIELYFLHSQFLIQCPFVGCWAIFCVPLLYVCLSCPYHTFYTKKKSLKWYNFSFCNKHAKADVNT